MDADRHGAGTPRLFAAAPPAGLADPPGVMVRKHAGGVLFASLAIACWPVLVWYVRGSFDGSNDPWGLLALATAIGVLWRAAPASPPERPLLLPTALLLLYTAATLAALPLSLRALLAALALAALGSAWRLGRRLDFPVAALALLALPLTASLQFYCGYPLRVLTGSLAVALLRLNGLTVELEGAVLLWDGRQIAIDAPCSGLRMLWAGAYLMAAAAALFRFSPRQTLAAAALTGSLVIAANAVRAAALFYLETGLLVLPAWVHTAAGMSVFLAAGLLIIHGLYRIDRTQSAEPACLPVRMSGYAAPTRPTQLICLLAALAPLAHGVGSAAPAAVPFPGWPIRFEGRPLTALPLTPLEDRLQQDFPGRVGRFTDGQREIILRWVTRESRQLHPSSDCFKASGYRVEALPIQSVGDQRWSRYLASRGATRLEVAERIHSPDGGQWSDVSAWYWAAQLGRTHGPWWAVTVAAPSPLQ
ncbi:MAG TPA: archaeosortase/exosortase family protein [Candidatus Accumulibacter phosphatis]|nr:archaeosortase/exosortase family protein [Candidatus Accumulibacter phosphatis]